MTLKSTVSSVESDWFSANQATLVTEVAEIKAMLQRHAERGPRTVNGERDTPPTSKSRFTTAQKVADQIESRDLDDEETGADTSLSALQQLCMAFRLSRFERSLLVMCAGIELDAAMASLCAAAQGDASRNYPTFSLALAALRIKKNKRAMSEKKRGKQYQ